MSTCNCAVLSVSNAVGDTAGLVSRLPCSSLWVEVSTLPYVTREVVSGILYPYNSDKTNVQKSNISTEIDVYSYRRAHRRASYSAGVICRDCGVVTFNTVVNLLKMSWAPPNSWNSHGFHIIALDLFCCHCRRRSQLSSIRLLKLCPVRGM
jgi:hypothetical protein